jgi:hypothetical protein
MFNFDLNFWCIGAAALGLLAGYLFAYSSRKEQPNGGELAALFGTVLGGASLQLLDKFSQCAEAFPLYVIGVTVGYLVYVVILQIKWPLVQHLKANHALTHVPLLPRNSLDPCSRRHETSTCTCPQHKDNPKD